MLELVKKKLDRQGGHQEGVASHGNVRIGKSGWRLETRRTEMDWKSMDGWFNVFAHNLIGGYI